MPYIPLPAYQPPRFFFNGHLQTVYPALFRKPAITYVRERITTTDGDFLDLDWARAGNKKVVLLLHGLEGSADAQYIKGLVRALHLRNWDAVAMNFRSCSGEPNRLLRSYHSGETVDLDQVIQHLIRHAHYEKVALAGFSLGGNVTLKYLGEQGEKAAGRIAAAATVSVPCDLESSCHQLAKPENYFYFLRFLRRLNRKVEAKRHLMPHPVPPVLKMKTFFEFDDAYTAPVHGFESAIDYYTRSSSRPFLPNIQLPTLLINAWNDPFLAPACFPIEEASENPAFTLMTPENGGHVGFPLWRTGNEYWHETAIADFFDEHV